MPDIISKIPIGFNLEGYDFVQTSTTDTAGNTIAGGVNANWSDAILDQGRWLTDTKLKQVQVQITCFQSAPLQYTHEGKKYYGEVQDKADTTGDHPYSITGEASFAGCGIGAIGAILYPPDINNCVNGKLSTRLQEWANNLDRAESRRKDFYVGAAIAVKTLADYLNHFYNLGIDGKVADKLAQKGIVCAETLFNTGGSQGKAFRIRVVDAASRENSTRGTAKTFNHQGQYYQYDVLDINIALLLTNDFSEIATINSKELNETVNQGNLVFPWASSSYNYKKAQIPGYGPKGIAELGLVYESKLGTIINGDRLVFKTKALTDNKEHHIARVRFFVDPENKDIAKSVIPNLPDEFFQTNYSDRATAFFTAASDASQYSSVGFAIVDKSQQIMMNAVGKGYVYAIENGVQKGSPILQAAPAGRTLKYMAIAKPYTSTIYVDCDSFVNWALLEAGLTTNTNLHNGKAGEWTTQKVAQSLEPGYKAIEISNITQAEPGDILIYGKGVSHAAVFDKLEGGSIKGYSFGTQSKANGRAETDLPVGEMASSNLSHIIRIVRI